MNQTIRQVFSAEIRINRGGATLVTMETTTQKLYVSIPAATEENEQPSENEVHQLQDSTITSELIQGAMDMPDIMENDYIMDEDSADIYNYIKYDILSQVHDILSHYSYGRLFPTLNTQYYWPRVALTTTDYTKTCDMCQKTKIPTKTPFYPLYPHQIATRPFQTYHIDFRNFRCTEAGNTSILVIVCAFSGANFVNSGTGFYRFDNSKIVS